MTWLDEKIKGCKHPMNGKDMNIGSLGGMFGITYKDGSERPPMLFLECKVCGYAYVSFENPPGTKDQASQEILDLANSFHNMRYDKLVEKLDGEFDSITRCIFCNERTYPENECNCKNKK